MLSSKITAADTLSAEGAVRLATRINGFWLKRGIEANARAELAIVKNERIWGVRSDLKNGSVEVK